MIKKSLFILLLFLPAALFAQDEFLRDDTDAVTGNDIVATDTLNGAQAGSLADLVLPESFEMNVDSLLNSWHARYFTGKEPDCMDGEDFAELPDSVYRERLNRLPCIIPLPYNQQVKEAISVYVDRRRKLLRYMLGMADFYFPMIEQVLDRYGLPLELKYLAVVESAMSPTAVSRAGATGMWQFMLTTGKIYGLEINSLVDERRDPVKATDAACRYFKDMYQIYGDWNLVMASYNCGPANVNKAIRRAGGKTDFWQIYPYLPRETRNYVPLFIAANYAMNYYCEHNICPAQTNLPAHVDTVMVSEMMHLAQFSETLNLPMDQLRALNPQFRRDIIPGNEKPFAVNLPQQTAYQFIVLQDTIAKYRAEEFFPGGNSAAALVSGTSSLSSGDVLTHTVRSGETLGRIANKYGVRTSEIMKWNGLKTANLTVGKRLRIYTDGYVPPKQSTHTTATAQKTHASGKMNAAGESKEVYTVKSGDSLYTIAQKSGTTVEKLKSHNNLSSHKLKVGQVLKIPKG